MDIANTTDGTVVAAAVKRPDGGDTLVVVLRHTFRVDEDGVVDVDVEGEEAPFVDTYYGADGATSSIRRPSELFDFKPGTDVLLLGHAQPPPAARGATTHVDVSLRVGPIQKSVRAYGPRVWQPAWSGRVVPGPAARINEPVPLRWELAYGGMDLSDPREPVGEPRNYLGRGVARDAATMTGLPAAQLEDPRHPLDGRDPAPACFGALHRHWEPRVRFAGTYDETWEATRCPLPPDDVDPRFHVAAPPDQWTPQPLRGDEPIEVHGATPRGAWRFRLPRQTPGFSSRVQGVRREHRTHLDGIIVDADAGRVELTFRAAIPMPLKYEQLDQVLVFDKELV